MHTVGIALLCINLVSALLVAFLMWTTYRRHIPRHPVVSTILWSAIPRAIVASLPSLARDGLAEHLPYLLPPRFKQMALGDQQTPLAYFCGAQAILIYYFLAVQSAFAVSFTVPMLIIATQSAIIGRDRHSRVKLPSTLVLCITPFLWSLPILVTGVPIIRLNPDYPTIYFNETGYCNLDNYGYQAMSGVLVGAPLIFATIVILLFIRSLASFYRNYAVPARGRQLDFALLIRFTIMLLIIYISAILLLCQIAILDDDKVRGVWAFDLYWETFTPFMMFVLFGSQRVLLAAWTDDFKTVCLGRKKELPVTPPQTTYTDDTRPERDRAPEEDTYPPDIRRPKKKNPMFTSLFQWERQPGDQGESSGSGSGTGTGSGSASGGETIGAGAPEDSNPDLGHTRGQSEVTVGWSSQLESQTHLVSRRRHRNSYMGPLMVFTGEMNAFMGTRQLTTAPSAYRQRYRDSTASELDGGGGAQRESLASINEPTVQPSDPRVGPHRLATVPDTTKNNRREKRSHDRRRRSRHELDIPSLDQPYTIHLQPPSSPPSVTPPRAALSPTALYNDSDEQIDEEPGGQQTPYVLDELDGIFVSSARMDTPLEHAQDAYGQAGGGIVRRW